MAIHVHLPLLCLLALATLSSQPTSLHAGVSPTSRTMGSSAPLETEPLVVNPAFAAFVEDRIQVGFRISHKALLNPSSESFIGSVNELSEQQHYLPPQLFLSVLLNRHLGIELSHDQIEAKTITSDDDHTDGVLNLRGPTLQVFGNYPFMMQVAGNSLRTDLRAGFGIALLRGTFEDEPWWRHGFPGPPDESQQLYADWLAAGAPEWPNNGLQRHMSIEDDVTWFLAGSIQTRFYDRLSAELRLQYMPLQSDATVDLSFGGEPYQRRHGSFDLDTLSIGIGILYTF
jgi:hypothetical protein